MPNIDIFFSTVNGGYPHALNGSTSAIINDSNPFYVDLGKSAGYGTMEVSDPSNNNLISGTTITSLSIVLLNGFGAESATIQAEIWNHSTSTYTPAFIVDPPNSADTIEIIPSSIPLWNKTWNITDLENIKVKLSNPIEPQGGIALVSTFIYLMVGYTPPPGKLTLRDGKVFLKEGKIEL